MVKERERISKHECTRQLNALGDALYVIGGKWKLRVIIALREGSTRFNLIQRSIPGISAKVLAGELKDLEMNGFVTRSVHTGTPVMVVYELTDYADTLNEVLAALSKWGISHRERIRERSI